MHTSLAPEWTDAATLAAPSPKANDGELVARFLSDRDDEAFAALLQRHGPSVLAVCRRLLGAGQDADDAFQATFLVLLRRAGGIREPESVGSWLIGVARRVALRAKVRAEQRMGREGVDVDALEVACRDGGHDRDLEPILRAEVNRLPEQYRRPIELCYWQGLSNEEAASRLDCPTGTVKWRLSRGREILRGRLTRLGLAAFLLSFFGRGRSAGAAVADAGLDTARRDSTRAARTAVPDGLQASTLKIAIFARENPRVLARLAGLPLASPAASAGLRAGRWSWWLAMFGVGAVAWFIAFWALAFSPSLGAASPAGGSVPSPDSASCQTDGHGSALRRVVTTP